MLNRYNMYKELVSWFLRVLSVIQNLNLNVRRLYVRIVRFKNALFVVRNLNLSIRIHRKLVVLNVEGFIEKNPELPNHQELKLRRLLNQNMMI